MTAWCFGLDGVVVGNTHRDSTDQRGSAAAPRDSRRPPEAVQGTMLPEFFGVFRQRAECLPNFREAARGLGAGRAEAPNRPSR
jgi:hypothetical protein